MMLRKYYEESADLGVISSLVGVTDGILGFFDRQIREKGYLTRTRYWDFFDWVPEWENGTPPVAEDDVHTLYNLFYAVALEDAAFLARAANRDALADEYLERKAAVLSCVRSLCYDENKKMYRDGAHSATFSMHTTIFAILADAYDEKTLSGFLEGLFAKGIIKSCFSMNFFLFRALEKVGRFDLVPDFLDGWYTMLRNGCTSWCENPDHPRSECHGWSCAPIYEFATNILGVKISADDEIFIHPQPLHLSYAKGCVPSRFGNIFVEWEKSGGGFSICIHSPEKIRKRVLVPSLGEVVFYDSYKEFKI